VTSDSGLCARCVHARAVGQGRFLLCTRSRDDPRYPRYPRLPVVQCEGYEAEPNVSDAATAKTDPDD
jgi:hypothetical protein